MKRGAARLLLAGGILCAGALAALWLTEGTDGAILLLTAGVLLLAFGLALLNKEVYRPLSELEETVSHWPETEPEELRRQMDKITGAPRGTAEAMLGHMESLEGKLKGIRAVTERETEQRLRSQLATEIGRSALPQVLPDYPSREDFSVAGMVEPGASPSCTFYDYFYIDPGLLCLVIGQTSGGGVAEALYMVVAQTTIRSRLRQGLSLAETLADVNRQLYDLGSKQSLSALVGTLNTSDGRLSYVNAGQQRPLLMRNEERYEWLEAPVYAALGLNENVSYRTMELRLKQGDRLFLHTSGLGDLTDREGVPFREQAFRAALNRSRSQVREPEEILRFTADEAAAYCDRDADLLGYAALVLEYRRGTRELAHCEVPASPSSAAEVADFLKQQFEENGIQRRHYARTAVLVDELFALCCRRAAPDSLVNTECGIAPDGQSVTIRMAAATGGTDPLTAQGDEAAENAAAFIRSQAYYVTFKAGQERDIVTMVCFLE